MSNTPESKIPNPDFIGTELIEELKGQYKAAGGLSAAFNVKTNINPWSPITSTYISDNGAAADLAIGEIQVNLADIHRIVTTLSEETPPQRIYHDVPGQDWRAAAFDLAQLSRFRISGAGNAFFVNCAPRLEQRGVEGNNKGENVYVAMLPGGAVASGVSPHSFAFFRDLVEEDDLEIYRVDVQTEGSQFRSRDFFPWFSEILAYNLGDKAEGWKDDLSVEERRAFLQQFNFIDTEDKLELKDIPDLTRQPVVARTDVHGNLKLSISTSDAKPEWLGKPLQVTVKGQTFEAEIRKNMFDASSDRRGISTGSSGQFPDSSKPDPRFLEIAIIGKSLREDLALSDQDLKEGVDVFIDVSDDHHEHDVALSNGADNDGLTHPEA
tara:strand:+ start:1229 stop:2371 length:1143 start_codon:yes stop_codon:yes gene_type:complete